MPESAESIWTTARRSDVRLAELVAAMSLATDLGMAQPLESGLAVCLVSVRLAQAMGLSDDEVASVYHLALLRHVGCTAENHEVAAMFGDELAMRSGMGTLDMSKGGQVLPYMLAHVRRTFAPMQRPVAVARMMSGAKKMKQGAAAVCEVARMLADRFGFDRDLQADLDHMYERWDGKGFPGAVGGETIRPRTRIVQVAEGATAFAHFVGRDAAVAAVRDRAGDWYAPDVAEAFLRSPDEILEPMTAPSLWDAVLDAEPEPRLRMNEETIDSALQAIGEFADLKSPFLVGHSIGVSRLAADAAERAGLPAVDATAVRRAALAHDLGRAGVSSAIWGKAGPLTQDEWEKVRMHAYFTDRVLARSPFLAELSRVASMHHERLDASGYFRAVPATQQPSAARVLAAADAFHAMTEPRPHRRAMPPERAAEELRGEVRAGRLDADACEAVLAAAGQPIRRRRDQVAGLTSRELEVLRLLARGSSIKDVARALVISPKTADAHIQHIYGKIGVSTRAAATVFAMRHGLVETLPD